MLCDEEISRREPHRLNGVLLTAQAFTGCCVPALAGVVLAVINAGKSTNAYHGSRLLSTAYSGAGDGGSDARINVKPLPHKSVSATATRRWRHPLIDAYRLLVVPCRRAEMKRVHPLIAINDL